MFDVSILFRGSSDTLEFSAPNLSVNVQPIIMTLFFARMSKFREPCVVLITERWTTNNLEVEFSTEADAYDYFAGEDWKNNFHCAD